MPRNEAKEVGSIPEAFRDALGDAEEPIYRKIMTICPAKDKASFSFKRKTHNKQLAKMGIQTGTQAPSLPCDFRLVAGIPNGFRALSMHNQNGSRQVKQNVIYLKM